jgi:hypothetical protein
MVEKYADLAVENPSSLNFFKAARKRAAQPI